MVLFVGKGERTIELVKLEGWKPYYDVDRE
jgi:hypothetical protein